MNAADRFACLPSLLDGDHDFRRRGRWVNVECRVDIGDEPLPRHHCLLRCMSPVMCRFSDAGMTKLSTRTDGRRPKSAKARNRGRWGR